MVFKPQNSTDSLLRQIGGLFKEKLKFGDERVCADEREHLSSPCEGEWENENHEDSHLEHQESEDLRYGRDSMISY